uniref:Uncharacterized protein n=1 Tax=Arundo donax TaxID=35708 RepID=A0A0A9FXY7_ARUDO
MTSSFFKPRRIFLSLLLSHSMKSWSQGGRFFDYLDHTPTRGYSSQAQ